MKKLIFILLLCFAHAYAQENFAQLEDQPKWILKFAPRALSPRIMYEKVINDKSTYGFDFRMHAYWLPQAIRIESFYRRYVQDKGPFGFYIQPKLALGYFDYNIVQLKTNGIQAGAGFSIGGQYNIGKHNAVVDVFGGIQVIAPIYINAEPNGNFTGIRNTGYNLIHYTLIAFPLDIGVRFGFMKMKKVPVTDDFGSESYY